MNDEILEDPTKISSAKINGGRQGEYIQELDATEDGTIGIEGSVGSDTDTSKIDSIDGPQKDLPENQDQARPNSLKKAATFKPVSVTKNFLAKAGTASAPTSKASGDKGMHKSVGNFILNRAKSHLAPAVLSSNATQSALRPRLVAKSASGPRTSTPKAMNLNAKGGKGTGPDPNQVWNRNRGQNQL